MNSKLIFIQLNEINFEIVYKYIQTTDKKKFKNLRYLINFYKRRFIIKFASFLDFIVFNEIN